MGLGTGLQVSLYAPLLGDLFGRARAGSVLGILTFGYGLIGGWGTFDLGYAPRNYRAL